MRYLPLLLIFIICSCEQVVKIDLAESVPRIVIEGSFTDELGVHAVKISKSISFYDTKEFPAVEGAEVLLTGDDGFVEKLKEVKPGNYATSISRGHSGVTYTLTVKVEGQTYSSSSYMPSRVRIDSVYINEENFDWWESKSRGFRLYCQFTDPQEKGNYVLLRTNINNKTQGEIFLFSDEYVNSHSVKYKFREINIYKDNKAFVEICSIDEPAYRYFKSLRNVVVDDEGGGRASPLGMMPANPKGNFTNGALGCFVACSISRSPKVTAQ